MTATLQVTFGPGMVIDALNEAARLARMLRVAIDFEGNGEKYHVVPSGTTVMIGTEIFTLDSTSGRAKWISCSTDRVIQ